MLSKCKKCIIGFVIAVTILIGAVFLLGFAISGENYKLGNSSHCQMCTSPCRKEISLITKGFYWCHTNPYMLENSTWDWDYCSTSSKNDHYGNTCSNYCGKHGEVYQWCNAGDNWGYCSPNQCTSNEEQEKEYGYSTYCQKCKSPCERVKEYYNWCRTETWELENRTWTWDYCSPSSGVDYLGQSCLTECSVKGDNKHQTCQDASVRKDYCSGSESCTLNKVSNQN